MGSRDKTAIIMPVTQTDLAGQVMKDLQNGTVPPDRMIIIDDSDNGFTIPSEVKFDVEYWKTEKWLGVNAYWNWGVSKLNDEDFVMILNDDVILHNRFLEMILIAMARHKKLCVVCPTQVVSPEFVGGSDIIQCEFMDRREGLAFTFRRYILDRIPPIPEELVMYFGEDWYWHHTAVRAYYWGKVITNRIYHYHSLGANQRGLKRYLRPDREAFERLTKRRAHWLRSRRSS
jgi:hypothetical protein